MYFETKNVKFYKKMLCFYEKVLKNGIDEREKTLYNQTGTLFIK